MMSSREIKLTSRGIIRNRAFAVLMIAAGFIIVQFLVSLLSQEISGYGEYMRQVIQVMNGYTAKIQAVKSPEELNALLQSVKLPDYSLFKPKTAAMILTAILELMAILLSAGYEYHTLHESRGEPTGFRSIFASFNFAWKIFVIELLRTVLIVIGFVLLIVPGIVLALRYRMAIMCLYDDPALSPVKCLRRSGKIMKGNKWRLFKLSFSFLPWDIVSGFVRIFLSVPALDVWLYPYKGIATGVFYNEITGWSPANTQQAQEQ